MLVPMHPNRSTRCLMLFPCLTLPKHTNGRSIRTLLIRGRRQSFAYQQGGGGG